MSFDWQTEETVDWDELPELEPVVQRPRSRWPWVLLLFVFLLSVGFLVAYRELNERVEDVSAEIELEVLASHELIRETAVRQDAELFVTFLSGYDSRWANEQEGVIADGVFLRRDGFGFLWLPQTETNIVETVLSPTLNQIELVTGEQYAFDIGNGLTETITLQHTAIYRLGETRWLLAPPVSASDFWGENVTSEGRYVSLAYPERDGALGRRLVADIDAKVAQMCQTMPELNCPDTLLVRVQLETTPDSLTWAFPAWAVVPPEPGVFRLPTPTLVGLPADELAYQALYRGYASLVVTRAITMLQDWSCCQQGVLYQALLAAQLDMLGLRPFPLRPDDLSYLLNDQTTLSVGEVLWEQDGWRDLPSLEPLPKFFIPAYALVTFLQTEGALSSFGAGQLLLGEGDFETWLLALAGDNYATLADVEQEWLRYIHERATQE